MPFPCPEITVYSGHDIALKQQEERARQAMQVVYHLGAHSTDEERLVRGLLRAKGPLAERGVIVPGPGRYRPVAARDLR